MKYIRILLIVPLFFSNALYASNTGKDKAIDDKKISSAIVPVIAPASAAADAAAAASVASAIVIINRGGGIIEEKQSDHNHERILEKPVPAALPPLFAAIKVGNLEECKKLIIGVYVDEEVEIDGVYHTSLSFAAMYRHLAICEWLVANDFWALASTNWALFGAAIGGHKAICEWAVKKGANDFNWALAGAAYGRHQDICEWAVTQAHGNVDFNLALQNAAEGGHLDICEWVVTQAHGNVNFNRALWGAAEGGHQDICEWAITHGANDFNWALTGAAYGGHIDFCEWAVQHGANDFNQALGNAARGGHLAICEWAVRHGANEFNDALLGAVVRKHLDICKWAVTKGATNNVDDALQLADSKGELAEFYNFLVTCAKSSTVFTRDNGILLTFAAKHGYPEIVHFLLNLKYKDLPNLIEKSSNPEENIFNEELILHALQEAWNKFKSPYPFPFQILDSARRLKSGIMPCICLLLLGNRRDQVWFNLDSDNFPREREVENFLNSIPKKGQLLKEVMAKQVNLSRDPGDMVSEYAHGPYLSQLLDHKDEILAKIPKIPEFGVGCEIM